jgi:hypothetical protein
VPNYFQQLPWLNAKTSAKLLQLFGKTLLRETLCLLFARAGLYWAPGSSLP